MADLERLTVLIEANTRSYERSMLRLQQQTDKAIRGASKSIKGLDASLAAAARTARTFATAFGAGFLAGGLSQIPGAIRDIVKEVADLGDAADRIGITTDRLQELNFQAEQTGSSAAAMTEALQQFSKRLGEARQGSGELYERLKANGIAFDELAKMDVNQALEVFIDLIGNARDESQALAVAAEGFGRAGADLALTFADGAQGAKAFADQAHRAGVVIKSDLIPGMQELDDQLAQYSATIKTAIKSGLLEFLNTTAKEIRGVAAAWEALQSVRGPLPFEGTAHDPRGSKANKLIDETFGAVEKMEQDAELLAALQKKLSLTPGVDTGLGQPSTVTADPIKERTKAREEETQTIKRQIPVVEELTAVVEEENVAQEQLINTLDEIRYSAGSALSAFTQSIADAQGPLEAMKASLVDILQTIVRIAEQQAISKLFGAFGTAGGGILGGLLGAAPGIGSVAPARAAASQAMAVHITAEPSPLLNLTITKSSQAAEERAIARGPVVARSNQMRYGIA
jgi:hypothetical protein